MKNEEILVYVIENEQPFQNWSGIWKGFIKPENETEFSYKVENSDGKLIKVDPKNVTEIDTGMPIFEYIGKALDKEMFVSFGLDKNEADTLFNLLSKMVIPRKELEHFYNEMDEEIPFEGGMGANEAITGAVLAIMTSEKRKELTKDL